MSTKSTVTIGTKPPLKFMSMLVIPKVSRSSPSLESTLPRSVQLVVKKEVPSGACPGEVFCPLTKFIETNSSSGFCSTKLLFLTLAVKVA